MKTVPKQTVIDKGTAHERVRYEHDAFGNVTVGRVASGGGNVLFGSALDHRNSIRLTIHRATLDRHLYEDRIFPAEKVVEIEMSEAQWATLVAAAGIGGGTPVTICTAPPRGTKVVQVPGLTREPVKSTFKQEIKERCQQYMKDGDALLEKARTMLAGPRVSKTDMEELTRKLAHLVEGFPSTMAFIQEQFAETMEKTVEAAKTEVDVHILNRAKQLGLESLAGAPAAKLLGEDNHG